MKAASLKKKFRSRVLFFCLVSAFFLFGLGLGFFAPSFFPDFCLKGLSFLRTLTEIPRRFTGPWEGFLIFEVYGLFVLFLLFLSSFLLGIGPLVFVLSRGMTAGVSLFYAKGALLSFPLIYPHWILGTFLFLFSSALFLEVGAETWKALTGANHRLKKEAGKGLKNLLFSFFLFTLLNLFKVFASL